MFLSIFLGVIFGVLVLVMGMVIVGAITDKRRYGKAFPTHGMTKPAEKLFYEYTALPADSRPFPDIISVLKGLDEFHSTDDDINDHFNANRHLVDSPGYEFSWNGRCGHVRCRPHDYVELHRAIETVSRAIAEKERVIAEAKVAGRGDAAEQLVEALRAEADIQMQVTKELL